MKSHVQLCRRAETWIFWPVTHHTRKQTFFHLGEGDAVYSINLFLLVALLTLNNVEEADSSLALLLMRQLSLSCLG